MYKDTDEFKKAQIKLAILETEVRNISCQIKAANNKVALYKRLIIAISNFDDYLKGMIQEFPEYYSDCKEVIDNLLTQDASFMDSTYQLAKGLDPTEN